MIENILHKINPYVRVAMHSVLAEGLVIGQRAIFDYELIYLEKGPMLFSYGGREYTCQSGDFIFIRPGVSHCFDCRFGEVSQPHVHFDAIYTPKSPSIPISYKDIDRFTPEELSIMQENIFLGGGESPILSFRDGERVRELLYSVIKLYGEGELLLCKARLTELIYLIAAENFSLEQKTATRNFSVAEHIKTFIDSEQGFSMSLDDFERQFSYSKFHLEKLFREKYGESLISYRNRKRDQLACSILANMSVSEVAERLGFSSIYAFSRAFKTRFGISPQNYKNNIGKT